MYTRAASYVGGQEMQGFRGGLNEGVWYMSEPNQGAGATTIL